MNAHIAGHLIVGIGAILLFIAAFSKHYRRAPLHVRLLLLLIGPVGVAWSILGMYLISHTTAQDHITIRNSIDGGIVAPLHLTNRSSQLAKAFGAAQLRLVG